MMARMNTMTAVAMAMAMMMAMVVRQAARGKVYITTDEVNLLECN